MMLFHKKEKNEPQKTERILEQGIARKERKEIKEKLVDDIF